MAKIKVEPHPKQKENLYGSSAIQYAFVSSPKDGRRQCATFSTCRDFMHEMVRGHVYGHVGSSAGYEYDVDPPIDMSKLRLLLSKDFGDRDGHKEFRDKLFSGKRLLNFYEKLAGWKESKITTVNYSVRDHAWLMTGPKGWMQYPQLLSLVTLILRVSSKFGPIEFNDSKDIEKFYDKIANDTPYNDPGYINSCKDKLYTIMKNHKELFTDDLKKAYSSHNTYSFHSNGGIVALCRFHGGKEALHERLRALLKKSEKA